VSVGSDIAQARRQAGLTVTEVSQRTRIRETLIHGIEDDDYGQCGGDFYARGFIRSIARVVGADPGPMIADYDAAHGVPQTDMADLPWPVAAIKLRERRRLNWTAALGLALVLALGFAAYHLISASGHPRAAASRIADKPRRVTAPSAPAKSPGPRSYAHKVVIQLTAVGNCWVGFSTPANKVLFQSYLMAGTSKRWIFAHAVDMRLGNPSGVKLTVDGRNPLRPGTTSPVTLNLRPRGHSG
jgi:Helix-turn-helix domain/RodZ C-terminal domain